MPIITSRFDTDYYKFTMMYAAIKTCERLGIDMPTVVYKFKCRNNKNLLPHIDKIRKEISNFQNLPITDKELWWISSPMHPFDKEFPRFLKHSTLRDAHVMVYEREGELNIEVEGPWHVAIEFETPVLAIVSEIYMSTRPNKNGQENLNGFMSRMQRLGSGFVDFGTRRRYSKKWQQHCVKEAARFGILHGTSNMRLAMGFGIPVKGTMAHEWLMAFQALSSRIENFQKEAFEHWMLTYRGKLGVALTDILGIDHFLKDWDPLLMRNFPVLRHDSGDPLVFVDKVYRHYMDNDTQAPLLFFSDGLDPEKFKQIVNHMQGSKWRQVSRDIVPPGIGTNFTNNVGQEPLQIVMKLNKVNGQPVVKMSDTKGKAMGDEDMATRLINAFKLKG